MHLRRRISYELNARVMAHLPAAAATVWDKSGVVVVIEQAKFKPAGGIIKDGFERLFSFDAAVRVELQTDDLDSLDVGEELVASLLGQPIILTTQDVALGAISEMAAVRLLEMRVIAREARLILSLTLSATGEALRLVGAGTLPHDVNVPAPLVGIGEGAP